jgi:hypothetical protein
LSVASSPNATAGSPSEQVLAADTDVVASGRASGPEDTPANTTSTGQSDKTGDAEAGAATGADYDSHCADCRTEFKVSHKGALITTATLIRKFQREYFWSVKTL